MVRVCQLSNGLVCRLFFSHGAIHLTCLFLLLPGICISLAACQQRQIATMQAFRWWFWYQYTVSGTVIFLAYFRAWNNLVLMMVYSYSIGNRTGSSVLARFLKFDLIAKRISRAKTILPCVLLSFRKQTARFSTFLHLTKPVDASLNPRILCKKIIA